MVLKRSWPFGVSLGALLLLAGMAQAAEQGYWKQQGEVEYPNKQLPPHAPNPTTLGNPAAWRCKYETGNGKARFTATNPSGDGIIVVTEFTWTPPPTVMIPGQVVPVSGSIQTLKATPGLGGGGLYYVFSPSPSGGGDNDLFDGLPHISVANGEFTNTKNSVGGGRKGETRYLVASMAACSDPFKVVTPYVWVDGVPPKSPPPPPLPPKIVVTDGRIPPFTATPPVTAAPTGPTPPGPTPPGPTAPGPAMDIAGTWRHGAGGETWTFTPQGAGRYAAVEKGFGNARGTAVATGNKVTIDYTTQDGKKTGKYQLTIAADGRTATSTWKLNTGETGALNWVRVDGPSTTRMTLRAETRKAKTGETVTVPVWLLKGAGLIDMNFNLEYDPTVVQVVGSVVKGNLLDGADFEVNSGKPGVVQIGLVPKTGGVAASDGTVAQITFKAVGLAGSRSTLRLVPRKASLTGGAAASPATLDGEVQIVDDAGLVPCDINGDSKVGMDDVLLALKISVGLLPHNARADVDKDGQVTAADARVIRNRVLGIKD